jgi:alpha-galactosidase
MTRYVVAPIVSALLLIQPAFGQDGNAPVLTKTGAGSLILSAPKSAPAPRINGAKIFGVRPGHPFLYTIAATGDRPMQFSVEGLPAGLKVDAQTGFITGTTNDRGEFKVTLRARNALGEAVGVLKIVVGEKIALTPQLGWNSWNCFGAAVDAEKVKAAADAMVKSGLINHGWTYINIDDYWEINENRGRTDPTLAGDPRKPDGTINSNKRFPDMKGLTDYIHGLGLKVGLYSGPGPTTCGGCIASYQHEDQDAKTWADWGFDYIKYDLCSYRTIINQLTTERYAEQMSDDDAKEYKSLIERRGPGGRRGQAPTTEMAEMNTRINALVGKIDTQKKAQIDLQLQQEPYIKMRQSLDKVNRDILYSLCQYGNANVWEWGESIGGNSWRSTGDITDNWQSMSRIGFGQAGHEKFAGPGHWNDPDMLVVGYVDVGRGVSLHPTRLTPDEQYTHISLWCLLCSPLLIGCDMTRLDDLTLGLLSNDEVLEVSQDPLGRQAGRVVQQGELEIWAKDMSDGSKAVGIFNRSDAASDFAAKWSDLGLKGEQNVRDLWRQSDLGKFFDQFQTTIPRHGVVLLRIRPAAAM